MQRPKQQALAFLLGALLVGGVVGFSADRVFRQEEDNSMQARRTKLYDHLGLDTLQRIAVDSAFDASNCRYDAVIAPLKPKLDSIEQTRRASLHAILTPEQRLRLEARRKEGQSGRDSDRKRIKAACPK